MMELILSKEDVVHAATDAIFGKPIVMNGYRTPLVEAMVAAALPKWELQPTDYSYYYFRCGNLRLEVRQAALKQTSANDGARRPSWDISERNCRSADDLDWIAKPGRNADIYVLGVHAIVDESADHRVPEQWRFFVVLAKELPSQNRIGVTAVSRLAKAVPLEKLSHALDDLVVRSNNLLAHQ